MYSCCITYFIRSSFFLCADLKPENIGFDIRGDIKIFDFGLSKALCEKDRHPDGTYKLTPDTGSPRYMSPEVALGQMYNEKCDVYSFAIQLWEILALKLPYELYTPKSLKEKVYIGPCKRPPIDSTWSNAIKILLKRAWEPDLHQRLTMDHVYKILRKEVASARDGDESDLEHVRRRSTFVFRPSKKGEKLSL
jgi:serine/threonine protein kinase